MSSLKEVLHGSPWPSMVNDLDLSRGLVRDRQAAIDDRKPLSQIVLGDAQRRVREEGVPSHERVEAVRAEELAERGHLGRRAAEGRERFTRLAVADQLDDAEEADGADGADAGVARGEVLQQRGHQL